MNTILTVSQINAYIKSIIDYDENLNNIYVCGEISNFTNHYRTGHFYFTLKDDKSSLKAVMFRQYAQMLRFEPYNGLRVLIRAKVSVFERDGLYQLYVTDMQPDGLGELNLAFEQLKEKLSEEGLFSQEYKKPIPVMPSIIAVITSPTGAALQDIKNVISRRYPCCELIVVPVQVQGALSAEQIVRALELVNLKACADVIILARGGGSIEDLWSFNEEKVARAIFRSEIPVISGVGHETDYTISDFVCDRRAPTPSAAAEIATPDIRNIEEQINYYAELMKNISQERIISYELRLEELSQMLDMTSPEAKIKEKQKIIEECKKAMLSALSSNLESKKTRFSYLLMSLDALSPLKTLSRGYALVFDKENSHIASAEKVNIGDTLKIKMKDGAFICAVSEVEK
ncbi:MAG: exodeoxyribonuclease VII large subunit [Acutalibacteraceae bacterium]